MSLRKGSEWVATDSLILILVQYRISYLFTKTLYAIFSIKDSSMAKAIQRGRISIIQTESGNLGETMNLLHQGMGGEALIILTEQVHLRRACFANSINLPSHDWNAFGGSLMGKNEKWVVSSWCNGFRPWIQGQATLSENISLLFINRFFSVWIFFGGLPYPVQFLASSLDVFWSQLRCISAVISSWYIGGHSTIPPRQ